jgi:hypothetical protein
MLGYVIFIYITNAAVSLLYEMEVLQMSNGSSFYAITVVSDYGVK